MAFFEEKRLPDTTAIFMLIVAGLVDLTQFLVSLIPVIGEIAAPIVGGGGFLAFFIWFQIYGISYAKPNRMIPELIGVSITFIPLLDALPECICTVAWIIATNRSKIAKSIDSLAKGDVFGAASATEGALPDQNSPMDAQIAAQQRILLAQQQKAEEEYEIEEAVQRQTPNKPNARTEDYDPEHETANTSLKKNYETSKTSDRNPNTLNLKRNDTDQTA